MFKKTTILFTLLMVTMILPGIGLAQETWKLHDDLFSVTFPTQNEGWACGRWGTIRHTTDGGKTWQAQNSGTDLTLSAIFFVDSQNGWAVGNVGTILHTTDGGKTWGKQESPEVFYHMDVFFLTPQKGWIVSEYTQILHTQDGGATWQVQFTDEVFKLKAISFCDDLNGWTVGEYGFIYHTSDGGNTWVKQGGHFGYNEESGEIEAETFLFDVVALDAKSAVAVGADGMVIQTADTGKTWQRVPVGGRKESRFFTIAFDGNDTLVIGGVGANLYSDDRGGSWHKIHFDPSMDYGWLYNFVHKAESKFVAVGEAGAIYLSSSPGKWDRIYY
ncbi:MAG: hypothetical protein JRH15_14570 [Deltaproteobacteria bacterium]|nr:hypothetical protein [Deltaproteobacteria bacterium]